MIKMGMGATKKTDEVYLYNTIITCPKKLKKINKCILSTLMSNIKSIFDKKFYYLLKVD